MSEWQPIETAPKGESVLVVYDPGDSDRFIAIDFRCGDGWYGRTYPPTHWMPLPDLPA